jgi:hypothetical protein
MRIGKPIKPLPHPDCDYCGNPAVLARAGDDAYPYRDDHGPLWLCADCQAWVGLFRAAPAKYRSAVSQTPACAT